MLLYAVDSGIFESDKNISDVEIALSDALSSVSQWVPCILASLSLYCLVQNFSWGQNKIWIYIVSFNDTAIEST